MNANPLETANARRAAAMLAAARAQRVVNMRTPSRPVTEDLVRTERTAATADAARALAMLRQREQVHQAIAVWKARHPGASVDDVCDSYELLNPTIR